MTAPLRVAVVGAGPAGMYAAGHLLEGPAGTYLDGGLRRSSHHPIEVDMFDRLPTPGGLVRYGVAPDHPQKKLIQTVFDATAARPGFRYFGNVEVGNHIAAEELSQWYDAVIYAIGAAGDISMGIAGEELSGSLAARVFVAWYNGHPDYRDVEVDLSHERVVVVGNGNVALDVARILTMPIGELERTDIAPYALEVLRAGRVREVVLLGRRGRVHGAFTNAELEELGELPGVDIVVEGDSPSGGDRDPFDRDASTRRKMSTLRRYEQRPVTGQRRAIVLRFLTSPVQILGTDKVTGLLVSRNHLERDDSGSPCARPSGVSEILSTGLVIKAIGYSGTPLRGVPFDELRGVIPNVDGRVVDHERPVPGTYVTGWIKRGPRGIIGTNKKCARDTVRALLADAAAGVLPRDGTLAAAAVKSIVAKRRPQMIDQRGWLRIDDHERRAGRALGRPRHKITDIPGQLEAAARYLLPNSCRSRRDDACPGLIDTQAEASKT
ncbi:FAD-dependent oxidoreductase [Nocardia sp. R7R-8]|uniref:FAD-dependent oxidoreductase n=1 Tax=Nocardia sp. R7R-8 TaxID=3459304 RepID=UPI00403D6D03